MARRFALVVLVAAARAGCATAERFRANCRALGWVDGTPEHAACAERASEQARERVRNAVQGLGHIFQEIGRQQQEQQAQQQQRRYQQQMLYQQMRPRTCYSSLIGSSVVTNCY